MALAFGSLHHILVIYASVESSYGPATRITVNTCCCCSAAAASAPAPCVPTWAHFSCNFPTNGEAGATCRPSVSAGDTHLTQADSPGIRRGCRAGGSIPPLALSFFPSGQVRAMLPLASAAWKEGRSATPGAKSPHWPAHLQNNNRRQTKNSPFLPEVN